MVTSTHNPHEITLVHITNVFPARFVQNIAYLRERYEARARGAGAELARMELHSEGDGTQFPSLYIRSATADERLACMLLGSAMQIIRPLEDPQTGVSAYYLLPRDAEGRERPPVLLGATLRQSAEDLDSRNLDVLDFCIQYVLANQYRHKLKRDEVLASIDAEVAKVRDERNNNPLDKTYQLFTQARKKAEDMIGARSSYAQT